MSKHVIAIGDLEEKSKEKKALVFDGPKEKEHVTKRIDNVSHDVLRKPAPPKAPPKPPAGAVPTPTALTPPGAPLALPEPHPVYAHWPLIAAGLGVLALVSTLGWARASARLREAHYGT